MNDVNDIWRVYFDTEKERFVIETVGGQAISERPSQGDAADARAGLLAEALGRINRDGWGIVSVVKYDDELLIALRK